MTTTPEQIDARTVEPIELPPLSKWVVSAERIPPDGECVLGLVKHDGWTFVAQVKFLGNDFFHEFVMGGTSVFCSHWLPIAVKT